MLFPLSSLPLLHRNGSDYGANVERPYRMEIAAEELRDALQSIGRITGKVDVEGLLDRIFREFCIGK